MRCWSRTPGPSLRCARGRDSRRREPPRPNPGRRHRRGRRAPGHRRRRGAPRWPGASAGLLTVRGRCRRRPHDPRDPRDPRDHHDPRIIKVGDDHGLSVAERLVRDPGLARRRPPRSVHRRATRWREPRRRAIPPGRTAVAWQGVLEDCEGRIGLLEVQPRAADDNGELDLRDRGQKATCMLLRQRQRPLRTAQAAFAVRHQRDVLVGPAQPPSGPQLTQGLCVPTGAVGGDACGLPDDIDPARPPHCLLGMRVCSLGIVVQKASRHHQVARYAVRVVLDQGPQAERADRSSSDAVTSSGRSGGWTRSGMWPRAR